MSDLAAFEALLQTRSRPLLRAAYALTSDWAQAEDLLQTALTKTYLRWHTLDDEEAGEAYLRRVMFTTYARWWRRKWRGEVPTATLPDHDGHDPYADADRRDALRRALATLPRRQRAMLVLRFFEDMSEAQVAETLGVSVGTVKSTTSKALAKLRIREELSDSAPTRVVRVRARVVDLSSASATATALPAQRAAALPEQRAVT
jgi:RNA polymerase sigma-70 factor (sigma-E family)